MMVFVLKFNINGMKKYLSLLLVAFCMVVSVTSCSDDDKDDDTVRMRVQIAVRVDSRPPRSVTLFGGKVFLGDGHESNWQITQEYYRLYEDYIVVKKSDVVQLNNTPFKSNSTYAQKFLSVEYPFDSEKVFDVTAEMNGNSVVLVFK